jgi:hypothetical protein
MHENMNEIAEDSPQPGTSEATEASPTPPVDPSIRNKSAARRPRRNQTQISTHQLNRMRADFSLLSKYLSDRILYLFLIYFFFQESNDETDKMHSQNSLKDKLRLSPLQQRQRTPPKQSKWCVCVYACGTSPLLITLPSTTPM